MTDQIQSQVRIDAPVDEVWDVVTNPVHIGEWFAPFRPLDAATFDLRANSTMTLALEDETFPALIVDVDPPRLFSYRWAMGHPGRRPTDQNSTLVQFVITPDGDGTVLQVIETGFATANIPADRTEKASAEFHSKGWPTLLGQIRTQAELLAVR